MKAPNIGARVTVSIRNPAKYARGAAEALDGASGIVERYEENPWLGEKPKVLVRFDTPPPTWFSHQSPPTAFWFSPDDLT